AAGHAKQQPHLKAGDLVLVENLDGKTGASSDGSGAVREHRWREQIRWLVRELTGNVAGFTENPSAFGGPFESCRIMVAGRDDQHLFGRRRRALTALVAIGAEARHHETFGNRLNAQLAVRGCAIDECDAADATL